MQAPFKTPPCIVAMEGKIESVPLMPFKMPVSAMSGPASGLPPTSSTGVGGHSSSSMHTGVPGKSGMPYGITTHSPKSALEEEDEDGDFSLDEDVLKILNVKVPSRPLYNPDAPYLDLSGIWYLDMDRSDSMEDYLTMMGVPPLARQASTKLSHVLVINQSPTIFQITRLSKLGSNTKTMTIGEPQVIKQLKGETTMTVNVKRDEVETLTQFNNVPDQFKGQLLDRRTLIDHGRTMKVVLHMSLKSGANATVTRYFNATDGSVNALIANSPKAKDSMSVSTMTNSTSGDGSATKPKRRRSGFIKEI